MFVMHMSEKDGTMTKTQSNRFVIKLIFKILGRLICIYTIVALVFMTVEETIFNASTETESYYLSNYEDDYVEKDFSSIYSTMNLYDTYGEPYKKYEEICQAYYDYILARAYTLTEKAEPQSQLVTENRKEEYMDRLKKTMEESTEPSNQKQIRQWIETIQSIE